MKESQENNSKSGGKEITEKQSQMDQAVNKAKQQNKNDPQVRKQETRRDGSEKR